MTPRGRKLATVVGVALAATLLIGAQTAGTAAADGAGTSLRESLRLLELPELWVLVLVLVPGLAVVSWLGYRGEPLAAGARILLAFLRFVALATLLIVLFRPVLVLRREEVQKAEVIVLADDSASMRRKDAYAGDERVRNALEGLAKGPLGDTTRGDLARAALTREILPRLEERGYLARAFAFSSELSPISIEPGKEPELSGRGAATHIGDALAEALAAHRGRHVTDVVILSDGRQNGGSSASDAARAAAAAGIPVHTIVIGDTRPERNAVLELVEAPSSALEGDEVAITVRVSARGLSSDAGNAPRGQVELEEYDPSAGAVAAESPEGAGARRVVAEDDVELSEGGERVTLIARPGPPDAKSGDRRFRISIPPLAGETLLDDNSLEVSVHVTPEKVRVLYVDGYPRWEYRRLALDMLKRSDENIEFQAFLLAATPDFVQESTRGTPALAAVPTGRRDLLEHYDVVILGDVNPWEVSPDPAKCEEFLRSLVEFVERGGGLLLIAGEYDNPRAYVSTPLEALFPVPIDSAVVESNVDTTREFKPRLEDPANPHEIVRLAPDIDLNRRLWEDPTGLRGFYWYYPVSRAKPGAQVLLRHPTEGNEHGLYPLLVTGYYPAGRTLFLAFDETWRWRYEFGHRYHERFWRNAIRWLALGRMKSGDRRYRLEIARNSYTLGERVPIEARVLDEDYRPSEQSTQDVRWSEPDGRPKDAKLAGVPGRPGVFRGSIDSERAGLHRVWIESGANRIASAEFEVVLPSQENQDPSPDPALLREISLLSHGQALDLAKISDLASQFPGGEERREPISSRLDDVWDSWGTLLFALAVLSVEWILRKRFELV